MKAQFETPILYLIFNRPDLVMQTFPQIKAQRPKQLFIAADGPRKGNENDQVKCAECREWVLSQIDWDCEVKTLFREENLGSGVAVSEAISWFFENVKNGIILEDDIEVNSYFFLFMSTALEMYNNNDKVVGVSGFTYPNQGGLTETYFLPIGCSWGWGTWSTAWNNYNKDCLLLIKEIASRNLILEFNFGKHSFYQMLVDQLEDKIDAWDILFYASFFLNDQYFLFPAESMVKNLGFNGSGTHSSKDDSVFNTMISSKPIVPNKIPVFLNLQCVKSVEKGFENMRMSQKSGATTKFKNLIKKYFHL